MAEEIADVVSKLRIDEEEEHVLDLDSLNPNLENPVSLLLVGRLLTDRSFNVEAFKRTITTVWAPSHGLVIRVLKPNLFAFQFFHWRDMKKVLDGRPWCFDNMLIILKEVDGDEQPDQVSLIYSPFWIRLKNLPFNMRSDEVVRALIGNLGEIIDIEKDVLGFGRYRRVKVMLDITKPLRRYRKVRDRKGNDLQVDFAYERLPFFCLACGVMGHSEKDCQFVHEEDSCEKLGWSLGLKATPRKGRTKELEEELKFKNCKKVLFDDSLNSQNEMLIPSKKLITTLCTSPKVPCVQEFPKEGVIVAGEVSPPVINGHKCAHSSQDVGPLVGEINAGVIIGSDPFVFSASKANKVNKVGMWKRLARGSMEDKGEAHLMDLDNSDMLLKRSLDVSEEDGDCDDAGKRLKLSSSYDLAPILSAEVGPDQPRLSP